MKKIICVGLFATLFLLVFEGASQSFYNFGGRHRSLILTGGIGNATYFGDLKDPGDYFDPKANLTAGLQYFFHPQFSVRGELTWFQLQGSDADADKRSRNVRNLSFRSGNLELAFTGTVNLLETTPSFHRRPSYNAYLIGGVGLLYINPTAELDGERHALQPLRTEDRSYSRIQPVIPFGLGARIKVNAFFNVAIEGVYRKTFTDYLDDVSTVHPNKSNWDPTSVRYRLSDRKPELDLSASEAGGKRGDPSKDDGYFLLTVKAEYYLKHNFFSKNDQRKLYNRKRKAYYRKR